MLPSYCFKSVDIENRYSEVQTTLQKIIEDMYAWCHTNEIPFLITAAKSTDAEDRVLNRISKTHQEGRACDLSCKGWELSEIDLFIKHFSEKYKDVAAVNTAGEVRLIVHHDAGHGDHFHVQIRRSV